MNRYRVHVEGLEQSAGAVVGKVVEVESPSPGEAVNLAITEWAVQFGVNSRCDRAYLEVQR